MTRNCDYKGKKRPEHRFVRGREREKESKTRSGIEMIINCKLRT